MRESINPYQPPARDAEPKVVLSPERVDFEGAVSVDDIAALLGTPIIAYVLRVVSVVFMGALLFFIGSGITLADPGRFWIAFIGSVSFFAVFALILYGLDRMVRAALSAKRLVKQHPEMIGPLLGYIDSLGLTFYLESTQQHLQFSWVAFREIKILDTGIRFEWDEPNFFAVPAHCVDGFDRATLRQIIDTHRLAADQPAIYQTLPDWSSAPSDAIRFQNYLLLKPPASRVVIALHWCFTILIYAVTIAVVVMIYNDVNQVFVALAGAIVVAMSILPAKLWKQVTPDPYYIRQWGWVTDKGVYASHPYATHDFRWEEALDFNISEGTVTITFPDGVLFGLMSSDLISETPNDDWTAILDWGRRK